jgi:hypothetical protein
VRLERQPKGGSRLIAITLRLELGPDESLDHDDPRRLAGDIAHLVGRLRMRHQVEVDPGRRPVVHHRQVGDHGDRRDREPPLAAQRAEHLRGDRETETTTSGRPGRRAEHAARSEPVDDPTV